MTQSILLVDDATFMRMMCRDILSREGYAIAGEADDGIIAEELTMRLQPDLLLMDIVMPNRDGLYALQQIRAKGCAVKAVMCSAMGQAYMVTESLMAGASDFVVKPFQPERMVNAVRVAFHEERLFNRDTLQRFHDRLSGDKMPILAQTEIDEIIRLALLSETTDAEIDTCISHIKRTVHMQNESQIDSYDRAGDAGETMHTVLARLDKVEQGQEEIKAMLTQLIQEKNGAVDRSDK